MIAPHPIRGASNGDTHTMEQTHVLYPFQEGQEQSGDVTLTREMADEIVSLRGFEKQRVADAVHIANLKTMMDDGDWFGPSTLTFARNSDGALWLVDGQHRLRAFVEHARARDYEEGAEPTRMDWHVQVVPGDPAEAYAALDSVARNRSGAVIGEALRLPVPPRLLRVALAAAGKALAYSGLSIKTTITERSDAGREKQREVAHKIPIRLSRGYVASREAAFATMGELMAGRAATGEREIGKFLSQARVLPVCLETLHAAPEEARAFWQAVITGKDDDKWQVIPELRLAIRQGHRQPVPGAASFRARMAASGWNARNGGVFKVVRKLEKPDPVPIAKAEIDGRPVKVLP